MRNSDKDYYRRYTDDKGNHCNSAIEAGLANNIARQQENIANSSCKESSGYVEEYGLFSAILIFPLTILLVIGISGAVSGKGEGWLIIFASLVPMSVLGIFRAFFKKYSKLLLGLSAVVGFIAYSVFGK